MLFTTGDEKILIFLVSLAVSIFAAIVFLSLITYIRKRTSIDIFHRMRRHNVSDEKLNPNAKKSFLERVHEIIQQISKPLDDRRIFSKLRRDRFYAPSERTIWAIAFSHELNLEETEKLLHFGGYAFSKYKRNNKNTYEAAGIFKMYQLLFL